MIFRRMTCYDVLLTAIRRVVHTAIDIGEIFQYFSLFQYKHKMIKISFTDYNN